MPEEIVTPDKPIDLSPERTTRLIQNQATFEELGILGDVQDDVVGPAARQELKDRRPKTKPQAPTITFMGKPQARLEFPLSLAETEFSMKAPVTGEAITGIPAETNEEFDTVMETLIDQAHSQRQVEADEAVLQIIRDPGLSPEDKITGAHSIAQTKRPTAGELYADKINIVDEVAKQIVADEIDIKVLRETNQNAQMALLDDDGTNTWTEFMEKPRQEANIIMDNMLAKMLFREDISQEEFDEFQRTMPKNYLETWAAVKRGLLFSDPRPVIDAQSVEWLKVWQELVDMDGDFVSPQFVEAMEDQYGPYWEYRWGSFFAREVGVDATALWYASTVRGVRAVAFPGKAASLSRRAVGVGTRAAIVATAGTGVERIIQEIINKEESFDLKSELFYRLAGEIIGETALTAVKVMGGGAGALVKRVFEDTRTIKAIRSTQQKMLTSSDLSRIKNVMEYEPSTMKTVLLASIRGEAAEYKRVAQQVAEGISDPAILKQKRGQLAELTGLPEKTLELWLALSPSIFTKKVLENIGGKELADLKNIENIGRSQEFYELKIGIETNRELLGNLLKQKEEIAEGILEIQTFPGDLGESGAQRLKVLRSERAQVNKDIKKLRTNTKEAEGLIEQLDKTPLSTGNQLADKVLMEQAVGFRIFGEVTTRQNAVRDLAIAYITKDGKYQFRPPDRVIGDLTITQKFRQFLRLGEPDTYPNPGLMKDYFDAFNDMGQLNKEWERVIRTAYKGLDTGGADRVSLALERGNTAEKLWNTDELIGFGLNPKEVDAYYAVRQSLDIAHIVNDKVMVARYKAKGVKMYQDLPVNVFRKHKDLTAEEAASGWVVVQKVVDSSSKPKEAFVKIKETELSELTSVIPAHTGYVPRVYANANFTVSVINSKTGQVSRIAAVSKQSEAVKLARSRQASAAEGEIIVYHRWDENTGGMRVGVPRASVKVYDLLDNAKADELKAALKGADIEGADQLVAYFNRLDAGDMRNRFTGARQDIPIGAIAPTPQAIADYMSATAKNQSLGYWRDWATTSFKDEYKDVLLPNFHWSDPRAIPSDIGTARVNNQLSRLVSDEVLTSKLRDARLMQRAIKRAVFGQTQHERWITNYLDNKVSSLVSSESFAKRALGKTLESTRFNVIGSARGLAAFSKLMLGNVAQIVVQSSQVAVTVGAHPVHATFAAKQLVELTGAALARQVNPNVPLPRKVEQSLNALRKSGYLADVRTSDLANLATTPANPVPSAVGNMLQKGKKGLDLISTGPFTLGEATNRAMAFLTVRREFMDRIRSKQGVLLGLDGKPFRGQIDDDEFLRLVTNKAKQFALNMGKPGQLEALSGAGSVLFQFKQVGLKFINIFETKELSLAEKGGAAAAMLGLWGPTAIPFIPDMLLGADATARLFTDDPNQTELFTQNIFKLREARKFVVDYAANLTPAEVRAMGYSTEFYERLISKGAVNALTDGELDITNRVALGKFFMESLEGASPEDAVVSFGVISDLSDAASKSGILNVVNIFTYLNALGLYAGEAAGTLPEGSYKQFINNLQFANRDTGLIGESFSADTPEARENARIRLAKETGQAFSYIGSLSRFYEDIVALNRSGTTPELVDQTVPFSKTSSGRPTIPVEKRTLYQRLFGLTPGPEVEELNKQKLERLYRDRFENYINDQVDKFGSTVSPDKQDRIMLETMENIEALEATLQGWEVEGVLRKGWRREIIRKFFSSINRSNLPVEQRNFETR